MVTNESEQTSAVRHSTVHADLEPPKRKIEFSPTCVDQVSG